MKPPRLYTSPHGIVLRITDTIYSERDAPLLSFCDASSFDLWATPVQIEYWIRPNDGTAGGVTFPWLHVSGITYNIHYVTRPDWVPSWANYVAMDYDQTVCFYNDAPCRGHGVWYNGGDYEETFDYLIDNHNKLVVFL